ncbi:MAG: aminotransferase class I/II-fold pyridoxal phosphate-dependent enzyme [Nitrosopumilaceae archaeon]
MKSSVKFLDSELDQLKKNHLLRKLNYGSIKGSKISIQGKNLVNLCSNDYLGIPKTKLKITQMQSSSRLIAGNDEVYRKLESNLARHKSHESSLIYPTGYMANLGVISTLAQKGDLILSDELNHASIIESCKLSGAAISIYKHNDMDDIQRKLKQKSKNKFIITEGIFSMDGDFSKLKEISEIAQKNDSITIVDDAHGDFVVGKDGRGTCEFFGVSKKIDVYISSLSKGLGSFGGYVASHKNVVEINVNKSKSFIYTSALPSFLVEYSLKRMKLNREKYRKKLQKNIKLILNGLKDIGYNTNSQTHIIPIVLGKEKTAIEFGKFLFANDVYAQPIRYPTVPKNEARCRISVTAWLSENDINKSLRVFENGFQKFLK